MNSTVESACSEFNDEVYKLSREEVERMCDEFVAGEREKVYDCPACGGRLHLIEVIGDSFGEHLQYRDLIFACDKCRKTRSETYISAYKEPVWKDSGIEYVDEVFENLK